MNRNLASRMFANQAERYELEDQFISALQSIAPKCDFSGVQLDEYDRSFELLGFYPYDIEFTEDQLSAIWELGFDRFWIHKLDERVEDKSMERYFRKTQC